MFSDGIVDLVEAGVVTNQFKRVHSGRITTSFVMGTTRVYDFVNENPFVEFLPVRSHQRYLRHPPQRSRRRDQRGDRDPISPNSDRTMKKAHSRAFSSGLLAVLSGRGERI